MPAGRLPVVPPLPERPETAGRRTAGPAQRLLLPDSANLILDFLTTRVMNCRDADADDETLAASAHYLRNPELRPYTPPCRRYSLLSSPQKMKIAALLHTFISKERASFQQESPRQEICAMLRSGVRAGAGGLAGRESHRRSKAPQAPGLRVNSAERRFPSGHMQVASRM